MLLLEQRDDGRAVFAFCGFFAFCDVQRRLTVLPRLIDISTISQQKPDHFDVTISTSPMITDAKQRRPALPIRPIDLRAFLQQQPRRVDVAILAGDVQRRLALRPPPP